MLATAAVLAVVLLHLGSGAAQAATWQLLRTTAPPLRAGQAIEALCALDGDTAWVAGAGDAVFFTEDGGQRWATQATSAPESAEWRAVDFVDRTQGLLAGTGGAAGLVYATSDGGQTWRQVLRVAGTRFTGLETNGTVFAWACGSGGAVYGSTDGGATWVRQHSSTGTDLNAVGLAGWYKDVFIGDRGLAVGDRGTIVRTVDGGETWKRVRSHTTHDLLGVAYVARRVAYIVGEAGTVLKTTSWGHRWMRLVVPARGADCVAVDFASENRGLVALSSGRLLRTSDGGRSWHVVRRPPGGLGELKAVDFALPPGATEGAGLAPAWIAAGDGVFRYVAAGASARARLAGAVLSVAGAPPTPPGAGRRR